MEQLPLPLPPILQKKKKTMKTEADSNAPLKDVCYSTWEWLYGQDQYNRIEVKWGRTYIVMAKLGEKE